MLKIHESSKDSAEQQAAELLGQLACNFDQDVADSDQVILEIFPSAKCFGQKTQDIDLLVFYADYRPSTKVFKTTSGVIIHSFCATIELKGQSPEDVIFNGPKCSVLYNHGRHDVTSQSENQKYSVKQYIERNPAIRKAPWIINLIWLTRVNNGSIPTVDSNILGMDLLWPQFLEKVAFLAGTGRNGTVETFSSRSWMSRVTDIFSRRIQASKIDRKRLEAITKRVFDQERQKYANRLGEQLLIIRGRGGTGKTVRLIRMHIRPMRRWACAYCFLPTTGLWLPISSDCWHC